MKTILLCMLLFGMLCSCNKAREDASQNCAAKNTAVANEGFSKQEQELAALETEMIDFFQSTLEKNYGNRYAVDLLIKGLRKYDYNYVPDIDRQRLKEINKKLYGGGWFASYFFDAKSMNDSCLLVVPNGMTTAEYRRSARFRHDLERKGIDSTETLSFYNDSSDYAKWKPIRQRVENLALYLIVHPENGVSYYRNEMLQSSHPAIKKTVEEVNVAGNALSPYIILQFIESDSFNVLTDFKSDRDVQMFLTLYFWKYLCHSANVDFRTGQDRTEEMMKEVG